MTLGEGKRKVYMLLDEYSSSGNITEDKDIEAKMADFFDMAQKQVAEIKKLRRVAKLSPLAGTVLYPLPGDFLKLIRIWQGDKTLSRRSFRGEELFIPQAFGEEVEIEYYALPKTISPDTPDDYVFEVGEDGAKALPFFVASQQLLSDLVMDHGALFSIYQSMLSTIPAHQGESHTLVNSFYGR